MSVSLTRMPIAALLASSLLLAGCGDDGDKNDKDSSSDKEPTSQTSTDSTGTDAPSASDDDDDDDDTGGSLAKDDFFDTVLEAQRDAGSYKSKTTTTGSGQTLVLNAEATYNGDDLLAHGITAPGSAQMLESVVADGIIYIKGTGLPAPAGKWLKIDPEDPATANSPYGAFGGLTDPDNALEALDDPKSLTRVGTETIGGVETTHYKVVATSASYIDALDLPAETAKLLPAELPFDVWIDDQNRTIKLLQEITISGSATTTEQLYSDYGVAVKVDVPADKDTVSIADVT